ncbi:MAG: MFS transporter [Anaerolineae bacterium]
MSSTAATRLPRRTKLAYGMGDIGFSLTSTLIAVYYLIFLTDVVGLRAGLAGTAIMVAKQWDWINDPIVGHISDRTRSRWGRRRPYLLFGLVPFAIVFTLMWWRPPISSQGWLAVYYGAIYMLYDTVASFLYMPYFALTPELTSDYDERTALTTYRMAFSIGGSLIAFIVPTMIIGDFCPDNASRVLFAGALFALLSALPLLGTFLGTREDPDLRSAAVPSLRESVRAALNNKAFLFAAGLFLLTWSAFDVIQAVLLYFLNYWLRIDSADAVFAVVFVTALVVLPLWEAVSRHTNKRKAYIQGIAFWAVVQIVMVLLAPNAPLWLVLILGSMAGIGVAAAHVLPWAIIPDAVEADEMETGARHEGMFYSLIMLMHKAAAGVALLLVGWTLELSGYVPNAAQQPTSATTAIRALAGPLPALLFLGGIVFAALFPITREQHHDMVATLEQRRISSGKP